MSRSTGHGATGIGSRIMPMNSSSNFDKSKSSSSTSISSNKGTTNPNGPTPPVDWDAFGLAVGGATGAIGSNSNLLGFDSVDYGHAKSLKNASINSVGTGKYRNPFDSICSITTPSSGLLGATLNTMDKLGFGSSQRSLNSFMGGNSEMDSENFLPGENALEMFDKDGEANIKFNETAKSFSLHASKLDDFPGNSTLSSTIGMKGDVSGISSYFMKKSEFPVNKSNPRDSLTSFVECVERGHSNPKQKQDPKTTGANVKAGPLEVKREPREMELDLSLSNFINSSKSDGMRPDSIIDYVSQYSKWRQEQEKKSLVPESIDANLQLEPGHLVENKENHNWSLVSNTSNYLNQNLPGIMEISSMTSFENDLNLNSSTPIKRQNMFMESTSTVERDISNASSNRAREELRKLSDIKVPEYLLSRMSSKLKNSQFEQQQSRTSNNAKLDLSEALAEAEAKQPVERDLFRTPHTKNGGRESKEREIFDEPIKLPRSTSGSTSSLVLSSAINLKKDRNQSSGVDSEDENSTTVKEKSSKDANSSISSQVSRASSGCCSVGCIHQALQLPQQYSNVGGPIPLIGVPIFITCPMHQQQQFQSKESLSTTCHSSALPPSTPMMHPQQFMNFFQQYTPVTPHSQFQMPCNCSCKHQNQESLRSSSRTSTTSTNTTIQEIKADVDQDKLVPTDLIPQIGTDKPCVVFSPTRISQKEQVTITVANQTDYQMFVRCGLYHKMQTKVFNIQSNSTKTMEKDIEFMLAKRGEKILIISFEPTAETKYIGELQFKCRFPIGLEKNRRIFSAKIPLIGTGLSSFGSQQFKNF